jgi:predicted dehydrogenase
MKKIKIVGAGQLGSRHLQALQRVNIPLDIEVIDPSSESLLVAKERYDAVQGEVHHKVQFKKEISISDKTDIAIVATNSSIRKQVIEEILARANVNYLILEKILFNEQNDYFHIEKILTSANVNAWVNCPMRIMPVYQEIKNKVRGSQIIYRVTGGQFGLVTNAIHYLDHVADLTGCIKYELDTSALNKAPILSKRPGFHELTGTLRACFEDGSVCEMICHPNGFAPIVVEIFCDSYRFIVRESEGLMWSSSELGGWKWEAFEARIPFQSELTTIVINDLLKNNCCRLTPYEESIQIHLQLLSPIKAHLIENGLNTKNINFT